MYLIVSVGWAAIFGILAIARWRVKEAAQITTKIIINIVFRNPKNIQLLETSGLVGKSNEAR